MKGTRRGQNSQDIQQVRLRDRAKRYSIAHRAVKMLKIHPLSVVIDFVIYAYGEKICRMVRSVSAVACGLLI